MALFGMVSHGIERSVMPDSGAVKWEMKELLCAAIPSQKERHTGDHIAKMSKIAWKEVGINDPLFKRLCDNGANMIKGWEDGDTGPCADHTMELSVNWLVPRPPQTRTNI